MTSPLGEYYYELPDGLIARIPIEPRDSSKLLVCNTVLGTVQESIFKSLVEALPGGALLVMNETKVVPARIIVLKETGGKVELLFYVNEWKGGKIIHGLSDRKIVIGQKFFVDGRHVVTVTGQDEGTFEFEIALDPNEFVPFLYTNGVTPIPKYIGETSIGEAALRDRYQTVFAKEAGSIAAPTASLHFTDAVFVSLREKGIDTAFLTLHVGLGTFAPVTEENVKNKTLHTEPFSISKETILKIRQAKKEGRMVISVGTTALRAVESAAADILGSVENTISHTTNIFIQKPYDFKIADGLITNFHVPESSLMCLVDAFLDYKKAPWGILDVYKNAIEKRFRFYSFGDSMIIL